MRNASESAVLEVSTSSLVKRNLFSSMSSLSSFSEEEEALEEEEANKSSPSFSSELDLCSWSNSRSSDMRLVALVASSINSFCSTRGERVRSLLLPLDKDSARTSSSSTYFVIWSCSSTCRWSICTASSSFSNRRRWTACWTLLLLKSLPLAVLFGGSFWGMDKLCCNRLCSRSCGLELSSLLLLLLGPEITFTTYSSHGDEGFARNFRARESPVGEVSTCHIFR